MNIFINIYENWTLYEWIYLIGSVVLVFLLNNLATYLLTKRWKFNLSISLTYLASVAIYTVAIFIIQIFPVSLSHLSLMPVVVITMIITINWVTFIYYYYKHKKRKGFSLIELIEEHRRDTIRNIIFLTLVILSVSIFLRGELLATFVTTYITSSLSIYLGTILIRKFIHD